MTVEGQSYNRVIAGISCGLCYTVNMKSRSEQAKRIAGQMDRFSKENPQLKEALRVFDISYDQYQKAIESTQWPRSV